MIRSREGTDFDPENEGRISNGLVQVDVNEEIVFDIKLDNSECNEKFDEMKMTMTDISPEKTGDVWKRTLKGGLQSKGVVLSRSVVRVHYSLSLEDHEEPFYSTLLKDKAERHRIGDGSLLEGLEIGIRTMRKCEKAQFIINFPFAFGGQGCPPRVPEKARILAEVEVLHFVEESEAEAIIFMKVEDRKKMFTFSSILEIVMQEHANGNLAVGKNNLKQALEVKNAENLSVNPNCLKHYQLGRRLVEDLQPSDKEEETIRKKSLVKLLLNIAHCANKLHRPKVACTACKEALKIETSAKALYRFGIAKRQLEEYDVSKRLLLEAKEKDPKNQQISNELKRLEEYLVLQRNRDAAIISRQESCEG